MNFLHFTTNLLPIVTMIVLEPIGFVHNTCTTSQAPEFIKKEISEIEILPEYSEGLQDIEQAEYLDLVFSFHHEKRTELVTRIRSGEMKGVFASRSPKRPNHLGITTVKLIRREGGKLYVEGADALDGSPVIDIKYCDTSVFDQKHVPQTIQADSPRIDIVRVIIKSCTIPWTYLSRLSFRNFGGNSGNATIIQSAGRSPSVYFNGRNAKLSDRRSDVYHRLHTGYTPLPARRSGKHVFLLKK